MRGFWGRRTGIINNQLPSLNVEPGRNLNFTNITLRDIMMLAYKIGAPQDQIPQMLQARREVFTVHQCSTLFSSSLG
jgi:hypothetical protein